MLKSTALDAGQPSAILTPCTLPAGSLLEDGLARASLMSSLESILEQDERTEAVPGPSEAEQREQCAHLVAQIRRAWGILRAGYQSSASKSSVTIQQLLVLLDLMEEPLPLYLIAWNRNVTPAAASVLVSRLVAAGLCDRRQVPTNRRSIMVRLTPAGRQAARHGCLRLGKIFASQRGPVTAEAARELARQLAEDLESIFPPRPRNHLSRATPLGRSDTVPVRQDGPRP